MKLHYKVVFVALVVLAAFTIALRRVTSIPAPVPSSEQKPVGVKPEGRKNDVIPEKTISGIQQNLARREYNMSFDDQAGSFQSPNRKHIQAGQL